MRPTSFRESKDKMEHPCMNETNLIFISHDGIDVTEEHVRQQLDEFNFLSEELRRIAHNRRRERRRRYRVARGRIRRERRLRQQGRFQVDIP